MEPINIFDFDGTLTTDTWPKCWVWIKKYEFDGEKRNEKLEKAIEQYRINHFGDPLDTFFGFFNDLLKSNNSILEYSEFMEGEKYIKYNPGVIDFLVSSKIKKYIISGGFSDFLKKIKIGNYFNEIYGSKLIYNSFHQIVGFGESITNDKKIEALKDILIKNNKTHNNCQNVYYIGDGYSDEIAMEFVHNNGGKSVFVYNKEQNDVFSKYNNEIYNKLNAKGIIDFCCLADYRKNSELYNILQRNK